MTSKNKHEAGNLKELTYPGGRKVVYDYDTRNMLWKVYYKPTSTTTYTGTYTYDPGNRLTDLQNFNGTLTHYEYDNANRLTLLENKKSTGDVIASYSFPVLDGLGNRLQVNQTEPYTPVPNTDSTTYTYNNKKNRLQTAGPDGFTYDYEGQIQTKTVNSQADSSYLFDYDHRLKSVQQGGVTYRYAYDGLGNRLKYTKETSGPPVTTATTYYIYDLNGNVLAEADGNKTITRYYIHGNGLMAMVVPDATPANDQVYTYHFNAIGSTVAITNSSQEVVNKYAYESFGDILAQGTRKRGQAGLIDE